MEIDKLTTLAWRRHLDSLAGKNGMLFLHESAPSINRGQPHEVQYDAGFSEGYKYCMKKLMELISLQEQKDQDIENK